MVTMIGYENKNIYLPAPDPATPTVAAPAPMNLAAVSISLFWTETESGLKYYFKSESIKV